MTKGQCGTTGATDLDMPPAHPRPGDRVRITVEGVVAAEEDGVLHAAVIGDHPDCLPLVDPKLVDYEMEPAGTPTGWTRGKAVVSTSGVGGPVSVGTAGETTYSVEVRGRQLVFESIWKDDDHLEAVAIWDAHELNDIEVLWMAHAYLDGPFVAAFLLPYERPEDSIDMDPDDVWPGLGDDTARWVRRVWALWRTVTEEEADASLGDFGDPVDAGELRWVEHPEPGDGLRPVTVVTFGGVAPGRDRVAQGG